MREKESLMEQAHKVGKGEEIRQSQPHIRRKEDSAARQRLKKKILGNG